MVVSGTIRVPIDMKFQEGDRLMRKILIVVITTLGLVVGMGSTLGTAEAAKKPSKFKVMAEVSSHQIISGQIVRIRGTTKPSAIGRKVILQMRYKKAEGKWKRVKGIRVRADGTFRLIDYPQTARTRWYRVVKPAGDGHRRGVSKKMKVAIEPWDGRVDVKLLWETGADLNLVVEAPNNEIVSAAVPGPSQSGGTFNADSTSGCGGAGSFEQVTWPAEDAPAGTYFADVDLADPTLCDGVEAPAWRIEVRVNGKLVESGRGSGATGNVVEFGHW